MNKTRLVSQIGSVSLLLMALAPYSYADKIDADGFKNPLQHLEFNPQQGQHEFERATLEALHISDPF